ncbi:hypothetical protein TWF569_005848 [Orbilia oligospora]|uniref:Splicing factor Cactin n=1 Tax=Orbilia oligospora TaxID=2813651 RepID=A0A7C8NIL7_ORBOL|nr:hypothetical protein TWF103_005983 [Orbilia oligospora]KAF3106904.1 hypothetical protein TWF103_005983 [Orbilia oligospora]KAF3109808.1 hypothetical protein TWF102_009080 [Orbilia oligospora]KAF3109809.1 hypothetical protein TWF102_009080 [Orbilia oligospora]KAF3116883.1 hypothetical protein TWF706_000103 [Orbilia oligospora]
MSSSNQYRDRSERYGGSDNRNRKRSRSGSPPPWRGRDKPSSSSRRDRDRDSERPNHGRSGRGDRDGERGGRGGGAAGRNRDGDRDNRRDQDSFAKEQTRRNALQEEEQMREWVSQEDVFVLKQAKKKAEIRVKEGRAKPIDFLAVNLRVIDKDRNPLDDEIDDADLDIVDPEGVFEGLGDNELEALEKDIAVYLDLETNKENKEYWVTMKVICQDRQRKSKAAAPEGRAVSSVATDIDKLLSNKSLTELETLEKQITRKLRSNEPIDVDYWEQLLRSLIVWKAKARLKKVYESVINSRLDMLRKQQKEEAENIRQKLEVVLSGPLPVKEIEADGDAIMDENANTNEGNAKKQPLRERRPIQYTRDMDPEPMLKLSYEDKGLEQMDEKDFLRKLTAERLKVLKLGYVPIKRGTAPHEKSRDGGRNRNRSAMNDAGGSKNGGAISRFSAIPNDDFSQATRALYEREVARGVGDNEEIFATEEEVQTASKSSWASKYRPRKPRYFNRVQMGYEWNKYNQTHYDHDNPPPKVVQGYKFNIFYPDLIDKTKAPTYRIEREGGRKRGQSFAPAGEDDTCLIRFIAGAPYEDIAFRIVDKEWDYSAKRERGFRSSFEKGILQLHFQLKKIYYRK